MPHRALASTLWIVGLAAAGCADPEHAPPRDGVVLLVLDTLRADRVGAYGHSRDTSPRIDALADAGVVFDQAISFAPWTLPSMIALLSARLPSAQVYRQNRLRVSAVAALRKAGVRTAAFTEGGFASARFGLDLGFEEYHETAGKVARVGPDAGSDADDEPGGIGATFDAAIDWIRARSGERFFLLVHTYETHVPYHRRFFATGVDPGELPGASFDIDVLRRVRLGDVELGPAELAYLSALYDGSVRVADGHVGMLVDALEELGLVDTTAVIVTSDHGEDLGGRRPVDAASHGHSLYDELVRVPLVVFDPRGEYARGRVSAQVRTIDLMPTALDLLGVEPPSPLEGRSLLPLMRGAETAHRPAFSRLTRKGHPRVAVRDGRYKLVRPVGGRAEETGRLYDLARDPGERENRAADLPQARDRLEARLEEFERELREAGPLEFPLAGRDTPPELKRQLRALGYLR